MPDVGKEKYESAPPVKGKQINRLFLRSQPCLFLRHLCDVLLAFSVLPR